MDSERRYGERKALKTYAIVTQKGSTSTEIETIDISIGGLCLRSHQQLIVGQSYSIAFEVQLNGNPRRISTTAEIAYSILTGDFYKTGLRFLDMDSATLNILEEFLGS